MKNVWIFFCILVIVSCSREKMNSPFTLIDYTYNDGWTGTYFIKIDSIGQTYIKGYHIKKGKFFVRTEMTPIVMDSLFTLVNSINFTNVDTLYKEHCQDCGYYYLMIDRQNVPINIFVDNINNENIELVEVNKLTNYLNLLVRTIYTKIDSVQFEGDLRGFSLIPPPPLLKH